MKPSVGCARGVSWLETRWRQDHNKLPRLYWPPVGLSTRGDHHSSLAEALRTGERGIVLARTQLASLLRVPGGEMTDKESFLPQCWTLFSDFRKCTGQNPRRSECSWRARRISNFPPEDCQLVSVILLGVIQTAWRSSLSLSVSWLCQ